MSPAGPGSLDRVTANNPSPMTLDGTNSFVLRSADGRSALLVDPGPELADHKQALLDAVGSAHLAGIVLTHHHADHSEMLGSIEQWAPDVPVHAVRAEFSRHAPQVADGQRIAFGDAEADQVEVILTPGHTSDSLSLIHGSTLLSGDTVLGRGTTVIMYPEGSVGAYLDSLDVIAARIDSGQVELIEPAHGELVDRPLDTVNFYRTHRQERLQQVRDVLDSLGVQPGAGEEVSVELAERVADIAYAEVPQNLRRAVLSSVSAQLEYLFSGR